MNRSTWVSLIFAFVVVLLLVASLNSGQPAAAQLPPGAGAPGTSSQGTEVQAPAAPGAPLDDRALFPEAAAQPPPPGTGATGPAGPGASGTSSQGTKVQAPTAPGAPLDDLALFPQATASFYHIAGSTLIPVDSATNLVYDLMGCVHASAGATYLLNAPLNIPNGSHIAVLRLYYNDTSASDMNGWITRYDELGTDFEDLVGVTSTGSGGHGSNYGDLDHIVDTYGWSYVLNVRLNVSSSALQVCGMRVMYYPPPGCCTFLPSVMRN
jgi:hypothetical protein